VLATSGGLASTGLVELSRDPARGAARRLGAYGTGVRHRGEMCAAARASVAAASHWGPEAAEVAGCGQPLVPGLETQVAAWEDAAMAAKDLSAASGRLPEGVTSFVGRGRELAATRGRMGESRLVTLVGAGGVGKTRLAVEVAAGARRAFRDGVWMVDLSSLSDSSRIAQVMLSALGVRDQSARRAEEQLADHLRERQLLVVLDNCEHLLAGCAGLVARLLAGAPSLRVLATSREALGIDGEHLFEVPPLAVPDAERPAPPVTELAGIESVALLVDRARAVRPEFAVTAENRAAVAQLCARLDGMPLALELAATRLRSRSVSEVLERLDDRFDFLTGGSRAAMPRQQTLRALIDWSHELCSREEQALWARLSVFPGSFDRAAVEGVCAGGGLAGEVIMDVVDHLVAKSILTVVRDGERVRYRMLVTVREYGAERLAAQGATEPLRRRHRDHYLARAERMVGGWCGPGQAAALADMREDHPNLRAALEWSLADPADVQTGAILAASLRYHWIVGGFLGEGRRWLDQVLEATREPTRERGAALWVAAWVSLVQGDEPAGRQRLAECAELARRLDDPALAAHAAHWTALAALFRGEVEVSVASFEPAVIGHERSGDRSALLTALFQQPVALAYHGETARARETAARAITLSDEHGERWARAYALWATGIVLWRERDLRAAEESARAALGATREFDDGICAALAIELLAWASAGRREFAAAARLFGAARSVWGEFGTAMSAFGPHLHADSVNAETETEAALGSRRFEALVGQGAGLNVDGAIGFVLEPARRPRPRAACTGDPPLTRREQEVAALISAGMSNRAIAEALVLSPRTVDRHVERILAKLTFTSRAQIAAWVASRATEQVG